MKGIYYVTTWDVNLHQFTPQQGVRTGPYSLWGLRKAVRKLRALGYTARKGDPAINVSRTDPEYWEEAAAKVQEIDTAFRASQPVRVIP